YEALCLAASGRAGEVGWGRFGETEWRLFGRLAHPHAEGVGPLVYWAFRDGSWPAAMPGTVRRLLRGYYYNTLANNTVIYEQLAGILAAFKSAGIPVVVLKGAALAVTVYEDIGLRPMGDIDLLVRPARLRPAMRVLHGCGFDLHKISVHAQHLRDDLPPVMVELHWGLVIRDAAGKLPDMDWFWDRAVPASVPELAGGLVLAPEAHRVYLTAHSGMQHAGFQGRLIWERDLCLLPGGGAAGQVPENGRPEPTFRWPGEPNGHRPATSAGRRGEDGAAGEENDESPSRIFDALSLLGPVTRLSFLWHILFPPRGYIRSRYPVRTGIRLPYYYLLRWLEGFRRLRAHE
ncbi:MAG TPA: nucleotidyltransferase family protein, partial [Anaerolineales bacterium]|nr:nucleotidyltransferase family protein [Anaerolineales bacterium]